MKKKNYRDFTIGELLDNGLEVSVQSHDIKTEVDAKAKASLFEGTKQSTQDLTDNVRTMRAWKNKFKFTAYVKGVSQ